MLLLGYIGLVLGFGCLGLLKAMSIRQRPREIRDMINALALLNTEIFWGATPLPEAFAVLADRSDRSWKKFFGSMEKRLKTGEKAAIAWEECIKAYKGNFSLTEDDWGIIRSIGKSLGRSDRNEQHKQLELAQKHLGSVDDKARQQADNKAKMWSYLGFLGGMAIVVFIM